MKATLNEKDISTLSTISGNDNGNISTTIDYRMSIEDFSTAALEVDDSLIQAIQLISRKKIFRRLKQRVGNLPIGSNTTLVKQSQDQDQNQNQNQENNNI